MFLVVVMALPENREVFSVSAAARAHSLKSISFKFKVGNLDYSSHWTVRFVASQWPETSLLSSATKVTIIFKLVF